MTRRRPSSFSRGEDRARHLPPQHAHHRWRESAGGYKTLPRKKELAGHVALVTGAASVMLPVDGGIKDAFPR